MNRHQVVSGGNVARSRGDVRPPAFRAADLRPRSVSQGGGCPTPITRLLRAIDWGYVAFMLAWAVTVFAVVYVALGRVA